VDFERTTLAEILNVVLFLVLKLYTFVLALKFAMAFIFDVRYTSVCCYTFCDHEIYCWDEISSRTAVILSIAVYQVLRGQCHIDLSFRLLAHSVPEDARSCKSPTRPTPPLLHNNSFTVREFISDVIICWQIKVPLDDLPEQWFNFIIRGC
jgi:hypothetical protein